MEKAGYDIVVIGAGLSGIAAAVAAARAGRRVALVGDRPVPGGNASTEIGINIDGAAYNALYSPSVYARETGIIEEIKQLIYHYDGYETMKMAGVDAALFEIIGREKNITPYFNTLALDCAVQGGRIQSVDCVQLMSERRFRLSAPYFIDASGDGGIAAAAGASFMMGTEAFSEYGESLAPLAASKVTNGSTIMFHSIDTGVPQTYVRPDFAYDITKLPFFKDLGTKDRIFYRARDGLFHGFWWVEYGGDLDTVQDSEAIAWELRKLVYGFWDHIKNSGRFPFTLTHKLVKVCPLAGKRESRRFIGDHVLTQNDVLEKRPFSDAVLVGGWPMDVHADRGIYDADHATHWNYVPGLYNIPLRCLYSADVENLFFAGRNISATRIANGSTRVMGTCAASGQAVGEAAALCVSDNITPRRLAKERVGELQRRLLKNDQTIMGAKERYMPAVVWASSCKRADNPRYDYALVLDKNYTLAIPSRRAIDSLTVRIRNDAREATTLRYKLYGGTLPECYMPDRLLGEKQVAVPGGYDGPVTLPVGCGPSPDGKVYVSLQADGKLQAYFTKEALTGIPTLTARQKAPSSRDPRSVVCYRTYDNLAFTDLTPAVTFPAEAVLSGYNRPYGHPNIWISEGKGKTVLKAELEPAFVSEIRLVFDTDLAEDIIYQRSGKLIKDYRLTVSDGVTATTETVEGNIDRMRIHRVGRVVREIVFEPLDNYGAPDFALYGLKIYP